MHVPDLPAASKDGCTCRRTLRLRQKDVFQGGQPRLLLGEGHVEEFRSPVYNLAGKGSTPSPGKMFLTDVRVLWRADQNHEFNISIPITKASGDSPSERKRVTLCEPTCVPDRLPSAASPQIEGVSTRTTDSSGLALVVNTGADASNLVLGFTAGRNGGEEHLTRELFASVRQRWRANVTQPRFGTEAYFECAKAIGGTLPQSDEAFLAALVAARNGVGLQLQASLAAPGAGTSGGASGSQAAGTAGEGSAEVTATVTAAKDMAAAAAEATKGEGSGAAAVAEAAAAAKDNATTVFAGEWRGSARASSAQATECTVPWPRVFLPAVCCWTGGFVAGGETGCAWVSCPRSSDGGPAADCGAGDDAGPHPGGVPGPHREQRGQVPGADAGGGVHRQGQGDPGQRPHRRHARPRVGDRGWHIGRLRQVHRERPELLQAGPPGPGGQHVAV